MSDDPTTPPDVTGLPEGSPTPDAPAAPAAVTDAFSGGSDDEPVVKTYTDGTEVTGAPGTTLPELSPAQQDALTATAAPDLVIPSVAGENMQAGEPLAVDITAGITTVADADTPQMVDPATLLGLAAASAAGAIQLADADPPNMAPQTFREIDSKLKSIEQLALFWGGPQGVDIRNHVMAIRGLLGL